MYSYFVDVMVDHQKANLILDLLGGLAIRTDCANVLRLTVTHEKDVFAKLYAWVLGGQKGHFSGERAFNELVTKVIESVAECYDVSALGIAEVVIISVDDQTKAVKLQLSDIQWPTQ